MSKKYVFFDIECANNWGHKAKICSFGYVIVNENFNILEIDDLVMNPESNFQKNLFEKDSDCFLAYTKEFFESQPNFMHFYSKIKHILMADEHVLFAFAADNDLNFLMSNCERYDVDMMNFNCFDVQNLFAKRLNEKKGLAKFIADCNSDISDFQFHKSSDDAAMTMLLLKEFCKKFNVSIEEVLTKNIESFISTKNMFKKQKLNIYRKYIYSKIVDLIETPCKNPKSRKLKGTYNLIIRKKYDAKTYFDIARLIYDNGGTLVCRNVDNMTLIYPDGVKLPNMENIEGKYITGMYLSNILKKFNFPKIELPFQTQEVPNIDLSKFKAPRGNTVLKIRDERVKEKYEPKINKLILKTCHKPRSDKLAGKKFRLIFPKKDDPTAIFKVYKDVFYNGGFILNKKEQDCIIVKNNNANIPEWIEDSQLNNLNIKFMYVRDLYELLNLTEPRL